MPPVAEEMLVFRDMYWLRDLASKVVRRAKKLAGRPDPTPWVLRPAKAGGSARGGGAYVDFVLALDFINNNAPLTKMFHEALSPYGLSLLVANKSNVGKLTEQIRSGGIRPHVLLDLCSACHPEFGELLKTAAGAGVYTIGQPAKLEQWTHKARAQRGLEQAGLPVPATVVFRSGEPSRDLTGEERAPLRNLISTRSRSPSMPTPPTTACSSSSPSMRCAPSPTSSPPTRRWKSA